MGTNYYLIKKCSKEEFDKYKCYNDDFWPDEGYRELNNGHVYNNTYYSTIEELEKNLALKLHIGKSSAGWHFSLCIYPELGINNLDDWKKLFSEYDIIDEYDESRSADKMISIITERYDAEFLELGQEAYEAKVVERHNNTCDTLYGSFIHITPAKTYDEYLSYNNAERGLNGLLAHNDGAHVRTDGTYDLTKDWDYC